MRAGGPGAKPKYGYIAITFSATARCGGQSRGFWGGSWGRSGDIRPAGFRQARIEITVI